MKKLYSTENRVLLYLLQAKLVDNGIQCSIKNEAPCGPAAGDIAPIVAQPELWVSSDEQYTVAMAIVQEELQASSEKLDAWNCPQCKEKIEGQFYVCWKCGAGRDIC